MKKLISLAVCIVAFMSMFNSSACADNSISVSARCSVVIDATSGSVLFAKNECERASMASTTKIMTALILCENADLNQEITVTDQMVRVEGSSMGLLAGDKVHYSDLLYGLLLASGNDAANAVAISLGGSFEGFAAMMNDRARQIGMNDTNFVTPSGLDDKDHYTTAYDMALLAREAMKNDDFVKACSSEKATLKYGNPPYKRTIRNHNKLLRLYDDCIGVKTGFTKKSGRCLVSCAKNGSKQIIAVVLNAPDDWNDSIKLLDYGMSTLKTARVDITDVPGIKVIGGNVNRLYVYCDAAELSMPAQCFDNISVEYKLNDVVFAPVCKGDLVGEAYFKIGNNTVKTVNCYADSDVLLASDKSERDFIYWFKRMISA